MTEQEQRQRWNAELETLKTVVGARLGKGADPRDVNQAATGVLLVSTLEGDAFDLAMKMLGEERERRARLQGGG